MIFIIITIIVAIIWASNKVYCSQKRDIWLCCILFAIFLNLITIPILDKFDDNIERTELLEEQNIISLQDNFGKVMTRHYIAKDTIDGELYFTYMYQDENDIKINNIKASKVVIKHSDNPKIEIYGKTGFKNGLLYLISIPPSWFDKESTETYIIYIPNDAITLNNNIDLE